MMWKFDRRTVGLTTNSLMQQNRKPFFGFLLLMFGMATSLTSAGCGSKAQPNFARPPAPVEVTEATSLDVPTYLDAIGKTVAREVVSIQPQVSGRITGIHFQDGADVQKG